MVEKQKDYFTTKEAAKFLNVAVSTIQLWANNGLLSARTTVGGHRRISRKSVEEMLSNSMAVSGDKAEQPQLSVIVVEDDAQQRRLYEKHISNWNMDIHLLMAKDGFEGLIKIGSIFPDVIITDLLMPDVDGFQMIRSLKMIPDLENTLIIAVSALEVADVKANGGLPEGVHLFTKPLSFEDLEKLLRDKLQSKRFEMLVN